MRRLIQELPLILQLWFLVYFLTRLHKHYITSSESFQIIKNLTMKCKHKSVLKKCRTSFNMSALVALSSVYVLRETRAIFPLTGKALPPYALACRGCKPLRHIHMPVVYSTLTHLLKFPQSTDNSCYLFFSRKFHFCIALFFNPKNEFTF